MKNPLASLPRRLLILAAALFLAAGAATALATPTNVILRTPAGVACPAALPDLLSKWRQSGQVANALLLTDGRPEKSGQPAAFGTFVVLEFPNEAACQAWQTDAAPALPAGLIVRQADTLANGEILPRDSNNSVFIVNAYTPKVSPARFREFVDGYVHPLYEAMRGTKNLVRYTAYLEHGATGQAMAFNLLEYRNPVAFAAMPPLKTAIRAKLAATLPTYNQFDGIKDTLRVDAFGSFATYTELPPPDLSDLPHYVPQAHIIGAVRIVGSELKNAVDQLAAGFMQFQTDAKVSTNNMTSSEGGIAGLYCGISDVAPMGDDAKITDQMPFFNTFGYMPTEISVATGGYEKRGSLFAWAVVVNKDNPLNEISMDQLERAFGSERTGGWKLVNHDWMYTAEYARSAASNLRTWDQLGLTGDFAGKEIQTFGYCAPGFEISVERTLFHWADKWNGNFMQYVEAKQGVPGPDGDAVASDRPLELLSHNKFAIGIVALLHAKDYPDVKVLKIIPRSGGPAVALTPDNVANRTYPLARDAYFYVKKAPGQPLDPRAREFMRFVLSREGQAIIAKVGYYYPLPAAYLAEQLKKLD
ncbi:MAG: PstS family phosphate ABC transporter substrate-binding protein [Opitutales bacterium]